tara:strand:+ start:450 stop:650 length:201 start_codon:yes stop_codon:yes gene_type:complete
MVPFKIIWHMSGEVKYPTFTHQILSISVFHIVYSTSPAKQNMIADQMVARLMEKFLERVAGIEPAP